MKPIKHLTSVILMIIMLNSFQSFSQSFQNTFNQSSKDDYVAGVAVANKYYVLGNTTYSTSLPIAGKILFSVYNSLGASTLDVTYSEPNRPNYILEAADIQAGYGSLVLSPSTSPVTPDCSNPIVTCSGPAPVAIDIPNPDSKKYFYATGSYKRASWDKRKLLILKLNSNGVVLWSKAGHLLNPNNEDEAGVSVESCPNRDVFVVSQTTESTTGLIYPTVTRLDSNGNVLWRYNYKPSPDEIHYNFIPHQSCIFSENLQNGTVSPLGIAIVGEMTVPGILGSVVCVMRVDYDGTMRWKYNYMIFPDQPPFQSGWDIITEDNSLGSDVTTAENFVLTGMISSAQTPAPGASCLVMRVATPSGFFVSGKILSLTSSMHYIYGQGIYQAISPIASVVVTGGVFDEELGINDTYLTKIDPATGAVAWLNNYPLTTPNFPRTESVVSVGKKYPTSGYFLSTNAFDTYSVGTLTDAHVIKTDVSGAVNSMSCPNGKIPPLVREFNAQFIQLCNLLVCDSLTGKKLKRIAISVPHILCYAPTRMGDDEDADEESQFSVNIFPNPTSSKLNVSIYSEENTDADIEIISIDGKLISNNSVSLSEGINNQTLNTELLPSGMYFIRIITKNNIVLSRFVKAE